MEVSGQLYVPAALTSSGKVFITRWLGGCLSHRANLERGGEESAKRTFCLSVGGWLLGLQRDTRLWLQMCGQGGKARERECLVVAVVLMIS
jgi:hypothetical protein